MWSYIDWRCCDVTEALQFFQDWKFDRSAGKIVGLTPLDPDRLPEGYWCLVLDEWGRASELEEHRPDLAEPAVKVFHYDGEGAGPIRKALDFNPDGSLRLIHQYFYDQRGRMVDRRELDGKKQPRGHVESLWDDHDREVQEVVYDRRGCLQARHYYAYDDQKRLIEEKIFAGDGSLRGTRKLLYNSLGQLCEKQWYNSQGQLRSRFLHHYDESGQLVQSQLVKS